MRGRIAEKVAMLTKEQNDRLTSVGPGTPGGELMRRYWHPIAPTDGIFDSADEAFDADVHAIVPPGSHIVAVRAFDAAGNSVVQDLISL